MANESQLERNSTDPAKNTVQSLLKGFRVLEAFTAQAPELTIAETARKAGLDNATAFRFLNTLVEGGYAERVPDSRHYRLTLKVLNLGFNAIARSDLRTLARPVLRELVGELNEAASIGVLDGADVVYIERIQAGLVRLGVDVRIGNRIPAYSSAVGHAILACMPEAAQISILQSAPRSQLTAMTEIDLDRLLERLHQVKRNGFAASDQETVSGLFALAAPILDADGKPMAAVSIAAPANGKSFDAFVMAGAPAVIRAAQNLSRALQTGGGVEHSSS